MTRGCVQQETYIIAAETKLILSVDLNDICKNDSLQFNLRVFTLQSAIRAHERDKKNENTFDLISTF